LTATGVAAPFAASVLSGSATDSVDAVCSALSGASLLCVRNQPAAAPPRPMAATATNSERMLCALRAPEEAGGLIRGDWLGRVILDLVCRRCDFARRPMPRILRTSALCHNFPQ